MAAGGAIAAAGPWAVETILDRLTGNWAFEREIDNGVTVSGVATFSPADAAPLRYREVGRMRLADAKLLDAYADYLFATEGKQLTLWFPEGSPRLFQCFALTPAGGELVGESLHDCPPDIYRSRIAFCVDGSWRLAHDVRGPRKAYVSLTRYRR